MPAIRKLNSQHHREGTFRPHRHVAPEQELVVDEGLPEPPDWINDPIAIEEWHRIVGILDRHKVLRATDYGAVCTYCKLFAIIARSTDLKGTVVTQFRGIINDLGLTPVSRGKIKLPERGKKANSFGEL